MTAQNRGGCRGGTADKCGIPSQRGAVSLNTYALRALGLKAGKSWGTGGRRSGGSTGARRPGLCVLPEPQEAPATVVGLCPHLGGYVLKTRAQNDDEVRLIGPLSEAFPDQLGQSDRERSGT